MADIGIGGTTTLISATERLETMVREIGDMFGLAAPIKDEKAKQIALPTPAEQKVFIATHQVMCITSRLGEINKALTSLLSAIGD